MPCCATESEGRETRTRLVRIWRGMPLRRRLFVTSLIGTVPLILLGIFLLLSHYVASRKLLLSTNLGQAELGAAYIQGWLDGQFRTLKTLADSIELQSGTLADKRALALRQLPVQSDWDLIFITDAQGKEITNTAGMPSHVGDRPYFQEAQRTQQPAVSDLLLGRVVHHPIVVVAYPILHNEAFQGIVAAGIRPSEIQQIFAQITLSKGAAINLWGDDYRLIARTNMPEGLLGRTFPPTRASDRILSGHSGTGIMVSSISGLRVLVGYAPVRSAAWTVVSSVPMSQAFAPLLDSMLIFVVVATLVLLASLAWANYSAKLVGRQVAMLASSARCLGEGHLEQTIPTGMSGELADLAASLNKMAFDLRVIERMKTDFLSMVSHELKTPLTAIRTSLELMVSGYVPADHPKYAEILDIADRQTRRLQDMIENLLSVTRMEVGGLAISPSAMPLRPLLQASLRQYEELADAKHLLLHLEAPEELQVRADAPKVTLALNNFLDNAIKFTERGSITVRAIRHEQEAVITVTDTGIGFAPDVRERLFEKFYQAEPLLTRKAGGAGMGLFVTKAIIEAHGGQVTAYSGGPETGSTFGLTLPLAN